MTTRDIEAHLEEVYGAEVSRELISNITEVVVDEIKAWQSRPLDEVYPILYIDRLRLRICDNEVLGTKVAYLAIGADLEGRKHALGCWIQDSEGAKFWQKVVIEAWIAKEELRTLLSTVGSETPPTQPAGYDSTAPANSGPQLGPHADCPTKIEKPSKTET